MNTSNETNIKSIIESTEGDIAFVIGNGINRHFQPSDMSWECLLREVWSKMLPDPYIENIPKGISLTEFYDVIELKHKNIESFKKGELQRKIKCVLDNKWKLAELDNQRDLLNRISKINAPILTTNFDDLMSQSMGFTEPLKLPEYGERKNSSKVYAWSHYYSHGKLRDPNDGFAIWHINGMKKWPSSIKLGLSDYLNSVAYVKKLAKGKMEMTDSHPFYNTWFNIFIQKPLFIFGLGLEESEIFLRWLLIKKARLFRRKFPNTKFLGWYVMTPCKDKDKEAVEGKKFFLKSVGTEVHEVKDYPDIYETPWP